MVWPFLSKFATRRRGALALALAITGLAVAYITATGSEPKATLLPAPSERALIQPPAVPSQASPTVAGGEFQATSPRALPETLAVQRDGSPEVAPTTAAGSEAQPAPPSATSESAVIQRRAEDDPTATTVRRRGPVVNNVYGTDRYARRGDDAYDFTLPNALGGGEITLSQYAGEKSVVLVFYLGWW